MTDRPRWREMRDDEVLLPGTLPVEIDGRRMVLDDDDDVDDEEVGAEEAASVGAGTAVETDADGAAHAPGNGLDPAAAAAAALREVAARLVRLPKVEQELLQKTERERLGVSFAAMKAAIKEALEAEAKAAQAEMDAESEQAEASMAEDDPDIAPADAPVETDDEVIARLAKLAPLDYAREREAAAKLLGIKGVAIIDRLVSEARGTPRQSPGHDENSKLQGSALEMIEPEPWPEPVNGAALMDEVADSINRHVILPTGATVAVAAPSTSSAPSLSP